MGPTKVLIADDDESILWVLRKLLEEKGLSVVSAKDGTEASRALSSGVQLALLDINMPGKDGLRLLTEAKEAGSAASREWFICQQGGVGDPVEAVDPHLDAGMVNHAQIPHGSGNSARGKSQ